MIPADKALSAPRNFQLRCALAYGAAVAVNGVILPYFPVWLQHLAFSSFEIGAILAAQMILRVMAAPLAGIIADRMPERGAMLVWSAGLSLITAVALFVTHSFWAVLLVFGLQAALFAPYSTIVESIAVTGVRRWGFQYGMMRVWGSIGFVAATLAAGHSVGIAGGDAVLPALVIAFVLTVAGAAAAPRLGKAGAVPALGRGPDSGHRARLDLHMLMFGASLIQASHGMFYAFGTLHWQQMGFSSGAIGILWSAGVLAEILVFFCAGWIAKRLSPWTLMRLGCAVAIVRWAVFPLSLGFIGYLVLQLVHAFTFAFVHLGLQYRLVESVREEQESSVQGAYVFYNGGLLGLSTLLSGLLYRQFGAPGFLGMSVIAIAGLMAIAFAARLQPHRAAAGG
ncbi:MFS transporter [Rhizobium deserti]|uniref:MFS transporter n=1 Tax=Rhizobium deserti TaxID=2547961 RepID=A0A4R5UIL3_9HYPH|nr:MFS transporter [Rhizobium deserti]TDK36677.1 MFS transporter [Rhizobium deserti]